MIGRFRFMDEQPVNLDGFAIEDMTLGLIAFGSHSDPSPSLVIDDNGVVIELDGRAAADFDIVDSFIAAHGIDIDSSAQAMALDDVEFARLLVDVNVTRAEIVRLAAGATPAKLAQVLALLRPAELVIAMTKMRARRTPRRIGGR